jgi:hypothetical protein
MLSKSIARALAFALSTLSTTREAVALAAPSPTAPEAYHIAVYQRSTRPGTPFPGEWVTDLVTLREARTYMRQIIAHEVAQEEAGA